MEAILWPVRVGALWGQYRAFSSPNSRIETKSETAAIEGLNSCVRHYLAQFHRKTFCDSKAIHRVKATLTVFFTANWAE